MKHIKLSLALLFSLFIALPTSFCQDVSTQGTEFWVSFLGNGFRDHPNYGSWLRIQLLISAKDACSCTVTNPQTGWQQSFDIGANSTYLLENIDPQQAYMEMNEYEQIKNKGLFITTTDTVSVYCSNIAAYSFDVSYVMPVEGLADDYIIQTYNQDAEFTYGTHTSAFLIVATEDNTTVDITPSVNTLGGLPANVEYSITLDRGQVYQLRSDNDYWGDNLDLSGSRVTARDCKKIAVFNGNNLTLVPTDAYSDADCIFEQAMPIQSWGKKFIVTASMARNMDIVKITSSADNNIIYKNGQPLCTLHANQSEDFELTNQEKSCYLESTHSCAVYLYNTSSNSSGNGAPSMVWIAPVEQRIDEITFSTFNYDHTNVNIANHYMNIIVETEDIGQVYFDNELISPLLFERVAGNEDYSFVRQQISHGVHHLSCANGFNAHVYGFGQSRGYAYMVGSKATNLNTTLIINDHIIMQNDTLKDCSMETITFFAEVNFQNYELEWNFGDGTTSNENPAHHNYTENQVYQASLTVFTEETPCQSSSASTTTFFIDARREPDEHFYDQTCAGQLYSGYGFYNVPISGDTILVREEQSPSNPDCNHFVYVEITLRPAVENPFNASICFTGPGYYTENGFNTHYEAPGTYYDTLYTHTSHGCDSIVMLTLEVGDYYHFEPDIVYRCYDNNNPPSYTWVDGVTYTTDTLIVDKVLPYQDCEGLFTLDLNFKRKPDPIIIDTTACESFTWNLTGQTYTESAYGVQEYVEDPIFEGCGQDYVLNLTIGHSIVVDYPVDKPCDSVHWEWFGQSGSFTTDTVAIINNPFSDCENSYKVIITNMQYTPNPDPIEFYGNGTAPWVIPATEFQINFYEFVLKEHNPACKWDSVDWKFCKRDPQSGQLVDSDLNWRILEKGPLHDTCKVYVLSYTPDTVWLRATAYNECQREGVHRDYWMVCSFYDIDEQEGTGFEVIPNPNNGQMELRFTSLTGKIEVKVYDMRGVLIDQFQTYNETGDSHVPYNMNRHPNGIYYFVATSREGTTARKVAITQ
jgi:hypothetical protein